MSKTSKSTSTFKPEHCTIKRSGGHEYIVFRPRVRKMPWLDADNHGRLKPPVPLGKTSDPHEQIYQKYIKALKLLEEPTEHAKNSLFWISSEYQQSNRFKKLSKSSQERYLTASRILEHDIKISGQPAKLGDLLAKYVTAPMIRKILEKRLNAYQNKGMKGGSMVNYERAYLSSMMTWALSYIDNLEVTTNVIKLTEKAEEKASERYVTDDEYEAQMGMADLYLPAFFEVAYLCAARSIEVRLLEITDILDEGLLLRRRKGSKHNIVEWTPRLRQAIDWALDNRSQHNRYVFNGRNGERISQEGLKSAMSRLKKKMASVGMGDTYWTLHALKHKGQTDTEDKRLTGHVSDQMKRRYDHSIDRVKPAK